MLLDHVRRRQLPRRSCTSQPAPILSAPASFRTTTLRSSETRNACPRFVLLLALPMLLEPLVSLMVIHMDRMDSCSLAGMYTYGITRAMNTDFIQCHERILETDQELDHRHLAGASLQLHLRCPLAHWTGHKPAKHRVQDEQRSKHPARRHIHRRRIWWFHERSRLHWRQHRPQRRQPAVYHAQLDFQWCQDCHQPNLGLGLDLPKHQHQQLLSRY